MSLYDKASLIMTPSGVKTDKLYSNKPYNGNGDFTFDRNLPTATRVNKDGYIESVAADVPRLNYPLIDGVVQDSPSLLLEPARTNSQDYSEDFTTGWGKQAISVTSNAAISPDGTLTADKIIPSTSATTHQIYYLSRISSQTAVMSVFAKAGGISTFNILDGTSAVNGSSFDLSNKSVTNSGNGNGLIEDYGNGWFRCSTVATTTGFRIYCPNSAGTSFGDGVSGVYFWGAQLEIGSYVTSYIPNLLTGSTTRSAETANGAGTAAEFNDSEGVLFAEIADIYDSTTSRVLGLSDGTLNNRMFFKFYTVSNGIIATLVSSSGGANPQITVTTSDTSNYNKIALKYSVSEFNLWVNGFELGSDTVTNTPNNLSNISFDTASLNDFYGNTKQVAYFKTALTDSELEALTSWTSFNEMATGQEYSIQ